MNHLGLGEGYPDLSGPTTLGVSSLS